MTYAQYFSFELCPRIYLNSKVNETTSVFANISKQFFLYNPNFINEYLYIRRVPFSLICDRAKQLGQV